MWLLSFIAENNPTKKLAKNHIALVRYLKETYSKTPWEFRAIDDKTISVIDSSMPAGSNEVGFLEFTEVIN